MTNRTEPSHPATDDPVRLDGPHRPSLILFDVNETLSDMAPMAQRFENVGAPAHLAKTWFAGLLRDGFALAAVGARQPFARLAAEALRVDLHGLSLNCGTAEAVEHIMTSRLVPLRPARGRCRGRGPGRPHREC